MWVIKRIIFRRNLTNIFPNQKYYFPPSVNLRSISNKAKNIKNVSNFTTIEKSFRDNKDYIRKETIDKKSAKPQNIRLALLGFSVTLLGAYLLIELNNTTGENRLSSWKSYLRQLLKQIEDVTVFIKEPSREKLLPDPVEYPFYQPPYTLILEFTDVLAHPDWTYSTGWRFKKRPGLEYMLDNLVGLYEIVVFTAQPGMTIFPVIEALDPKNLISYKLVRDSTHFVDGHHVKNLEKLNRDLKKVIVVDWNSESVKFHPDNHLNIPRWKGENEDMVLVDLTSFLMTIAQTEIEDVREVLRFYKQYEDPLKEFRIKQREYLENKENEQTQKPQTQPKPGSTFNYTGIKSMF